jgi:hypothetical protein
MKKTQNLPHGKQSRGYHENVSEFGNFVITLIHTIYTSNEQNKGL